MSGSPHTELVAALRPETPDADLVAALLGTSDLVSLATILSQHVQTHLPCEQVSISWCLGGDASQFHFPDPTPCEPAPTLLQQLRSEGAQVARTERGEWFALCVSEGHERMGAAVCARLRHPVDDDRIAATFPGWLRTCVSAALETANLRAVVDRLDRAEKVQHALFAIADMAGADMDMQEMLRGVHAIVGELMYAENFYIALYYKDEDAIRFLHFVDTQDVLIANVTDLTGERIGPAISFERIRNGITWHLISGGRALMGSIEQVREQVHGELSALGSDCYDLLGVPMVAGGEVRGAMVVQTYIERPRYTEADKDLLGFVASHVLTALDRKQAHRELERRVTERTLALTLEVHERERSERLQATLFRIAELAHSVAGTSDFYGAAHRIIGEWLDCRNFYIALVAEDGETVEFPYFVDERSERPQPRRLGRGITEYVLRSGQPLLADMHNPATRARMQKLHADGELSGPVGDTTCWLGVPLRVSERTVGVLAVQSYSLEVGYTARDQELLVFIAYQIAASLERARAAQSLKSAYADLEQRVTERTRELREQIAVREQIELQLKHEVMHDALTGLPNRAYLREHLVRTLGRYGRDPNRMFAVMFLDLDRFKVINDSAGHLVGDALLKEVARRFSACVRTPDVVARLGGDEFAIVMEDIHGSEDAVRLARRIVAALAQPVHVDGKTLFTATSIGIAVSHPRYSQPEQLLRDADIALYRAKANDQQRYELFDEQLNQEALHLLDLENDLRNAVTRCEFEPYFQPIVQLDDASVVGYEALLRWHHPQRGVLAPGAFLHVAEASGCLEAIDWLMFERTVAAIPTLTRPGQYVNLNVSPRHFRSPHLDTRLLALLEANAVESSRVRVEVTEGLLMENPEQAIAIIDRLRSAGVMTALDDFGTGYSSLSYLHRFALAAVKIDRSFIVDLAPDFGGGGAPVVRAILALAQSVGLEVIAEGIETATQREALLALGCRIGQGYLFARPQPLAAVAALA